MGAGKPVLVSGLPLVNCVTRLHSTGCHKVQIRQNMSSRWAGLLFTDELSVPRTNTWGVAGAPKWVLNIIEQHARNSLSPKDTAVSSVHI